MMTYGDVEAKLRSFLASVTGGSEESVSLSGRFFPLGNQCRKSPRMTFEHTFIVLCILCGIKLVRISAGTLQSSGLSCFFSDSPGECWDSTLNYAIERFLNYLLIFPQFEILYLTVFVP